MRSRFLLSASVVTLTVLGAAGAHANPPNPNNSPTTDYLITDEIDGDFVNNSTMGRVGPSTNSRGLELGSGVTVTGDIHNADHGKIYGTDVGAYIYSTNLEGAFINDGLVKAENSDGDDATGIYQYASEYYAALPDNDLLIVNNDDVEAKSFGSDQGSSVFTEADAEGIVQQAYYGSDLTLKVTNAGDINATATATAKADAFSFDGSARASASATGISQSNEAWSSQTGDLADTVNNSGDITVVAKATAKGGANASDEAKASASANATGVDQYVYSTTLGTGSDSVTNSGNINASAVAQAIGGDNAGSSASAKASASATGVDQGVYALGDQSAVVHNDGDIVATARAEAFGGADASGSADASATAEARGIDQRLGGSSWDSGLSEDVPVGGNATASVTNTGNITAVASAQATGGMSASQSARASAYATATGINQEVMSAGTGDASVDNSGDITVTATAKAKSGDNAGGGFSDYASATAVATATGIHQYVWSDGAATASVVNSGDITVTASAQATVGASADVYSASANANAEASGINQSVYGGASASASVDNSSTIDVKAIASAKGGDNLSAASSYTSAQANAEATGIRQYASADNALVSVTNSGDINATASAQAESFDRYDATAQATAIGVYQNAESSFVATATLENTGLIHAAATAGANASSLGSSLSHAGASALAVGVEQNVSDFPVSAVLNASVNNDGTIEAFASATAYGSNATVGDNDSNFSELNGVAAVGVAQWAGFGDSAHLDVTNSGEIHASAVGWAGGDDNGAAAEISAVGVLQQIGVDSYAPIDGLATVENLSGGMINASAAAYVGASQGTAFASATAAGVWQHVIAGYDATATVDNAGSISGSAYASANGDTANATGTAYGTGVYQEVDASGVTTAHANVTNSGEISGNAYVTADSEDGIATAKAYGAGIVQWGSGVGSVYDAVTNLEGATINASATAYAGTDTAGDTNNAFASANGVYQNADGNGVDSTASMSVMNDGFIDVTALAMASADGHGTGEGDFTLIDNANATAAAYGVWQEFSGDNSVYNVATVVNTGRIEVDAVAAVNGLGGGLNLYNGSSFEAAPGKAEARAYGVVQNNADDGDGSVFNVGLDNSGSIDVYALAYGYSVQDNALAEGRVVGGQNGSEDQQFNITDINQASGQISASADAYSSSIGGLSADATAVAVGMDYQGGKLTGTVTNLGDVYANASADGDGTEDAHAFGIRMNADVNDLTVTNKGEIYAYAHVEQGVLSSAAATGIYAGTNTGAEFSAGSEDDPSPQLTIVNDGGTIFAGISAGPGPGVDEEDGRFRGNAINVSDITDLDQDIEIQLKGTEQNGNLYGNVLLNPVTVVNVSDGRTRFNGSMQLGDGTFDGGDASTYKGELNILDGGTLHLVLNQDPETPEEYEFDPTSSQPAVYVDDLDVQTGGTLAIGLSADTTPGNYGQAFANTVETDGNLKGWFIADYYAAGDYTYLAVVNDANGDVVSTFADVLSNTPLMGDPSATYNGDGTVDITFTRETFESVAKSDNGKSVGASIDSIYGALPPGYEQPDEGLAEGPDYNFADLIASIFALDGDKAYQDKLDELSAEPYSAQLGAMLTSFDPLNNIITDHFNTGSGGGGADVVTTQSAGTTGSVWAKGYGAWDSRSDSSSAIAYSGSQYGAFVGADMNASANMTLGLAGGYLGNSLNFDNGDHISYSGWQGAGYASLDMGDFYLRGVGGYGAYNSKSKRFVTINATPQDANGEYDGRSANVYGEVGFTGWKTGGMAITPFAGVDYAWAHNDAFVETGETSGTLNVAASSATSLSSSLGIQVKAEVNAGSKPVTLAARIAWDHRWSGDQSVGASFVNAPDGGIGFVSDITSAADSAVVSAGATVNFAPLTSLTVQYDGRFSSDYTVSSVSAALKQKF